MPVHTQTRKLVTRKAPDAGSTVFSVAARGVVHPTLVALHAVVEISRSAAATFSVFEWWLSRLALVAAEQDPLGRVKKSSRD